jgi:hypothetical protein
VIRLLRVELRRNALLVVLPVVALLWLASPIARHLYPIALWPDRSTDIQSALQGLCPFTAGVAAWMAHRERRRDMTDLLATTPFNPALRGLAVLVATTAWAVLGYLAGAAVLLMITSRQATWGHPVLWPPLVGLLAVIAATAVGFAAGRLAPSRFTAPLAAIGMLGLLAIGAQTAFDGSLFGAIGPLYPAINLHLSVFYPVRTDLAVVQLLCAGGVLVAALGVLVLRTGNRRTGVAGAIAGVLLIGLSIGFAGTAYRDRQGAIVVPALDDVPSQQALAYTPVCSGSALPVCVHPAFAAKLSIVDKAVNVLAEPLLGTPGLPVRAQQEPIDSLMDTTVRGDPPILAMPPLFIQGDTLGPAKQAGMFETSLALALVEASGMSPLQTTSAQRAVATSLLRRAGDPVDPVLVPSDPAVQAAAARLGALSRDAWHAWLVTHIAEVRTGALTLTELS